jgi:hypothetical protein
MVRTQCPWRLNVLHFNPGGEPQVEFPGSRFGRNFSHWVEGVSSSDELVHHAATSTIDKG